MPGENGAETWRAQGAYFSWAPSGTPGASAVDIFHVETGARDAPVLLLVHGFPTSSIDWFDVAALLKDRFRVCAVDFPGYGFSDKPLGWGYSLARDAELLAFYIREIVGTEGVVLVAHDRGSSVAINCAIAPPPVDGGMRIDSLVLTNANIYLPLSNLTDFQRLVLDPTRAPDILTALSPAMLAAGMGSTTFSPPRPPGHRDVEALTAIFEHGGGLGVLHETIQYLRERAAHERDWLDALAQMEIPTALIWGLSDTVSPPRVANYVWTEFLMHKPGRNRFYVLPEANHYLQVDRPDAFVDTLLHALDPHSSPTPGPLSLDARSPLLVDASRASMPAATEAFGDGGLAP